MPLFCSHYTLDDLTELSRLDDLGDLTPAVVSKYPINTVRYYTYSTVDRYLESAGGRRTAIPDYALVWS